MFYDVVIVGGGINGVGVAQAVASAGYSCLLIEKTGLAAETSSKSSKLIHGGLRYLENMDLGLVKESLYERSLLLKLVPDLVKLTPFNIPVYQETSRQSMIMHAGLGLYSFLASLSAMSLDAKLRYQRVSRSKWSELDGLNTQGLKNVFRYHDAQTDDAALTKAVMQSAIHYGAELECPAEVLKTDISASGCSVEYQLGSELKTVDCHCVVNAAGPWVNTVNEHVTSVQNKIASLGCELVQGSHLVLKSPVVNACYYLESPSDQRAVFLLPWKGGSLLGTTEHVFKGDLLRLKCLPSEQDYLLAVAQHYFPNKTFDIANVMTGLRVLPQSSGNIFKRSRDTVLVTDDEQQPRLVSLYGGKLTVYRATADKVLQKLKRTLPAKKALASTTEIVLKPS